MKLNIGFITSKLKDTKDFYQRILKFGISSTIELRWKFLCVMSPGVIAILQLLTQMELASTL